MQRNIEDHFQIDRSDDEIRILIHRFIQLIAVEVAEQILSANKPIPVNDKDKKVF